MDIGSHLMIQISINQHTGPHAMLLLHQSGFHLGFFVWGGRLCAKIIVCEACKVFEPIFEYQSPMHVQRQEFLLLDIVLIVKTFLGAKLEGLGGGSFPPPHTHTPVDETLSIMSSSLCVRHLLHYVYLVVVVCVACW